MIVHVAALSATTYPTSFELMDKLFIAKSVFAMSQITQLSYVTGEDQLTTIDMTLQLPRSNRPFGTRLLKSTIALTEYYDGKPDGPLVVVAQFNDAKEVVFKKAFPIGDLRLINTEPTEDFAGDLVINLSFVDRKYDASTLSNEDAVFEELANKAVQLYANKTTTLIPPAV